MSHYEVLGLTRHASAGQIESRYRELVKVVHPDKGGDSYQFQILAEAYAVLGDREARARYDESLTAAENRTRTRPRREANVGVGRDGPVETSAPADWVLGGCGELVREWMGRALFAVLIAGVAASTRLDNGQAGWLVLALVAVVGIGFARRRLRR